MTRYILYFVLWFAALGFAIALYGAWYSAVGDMSTQAAELESKIADRTQAAERANSAKAILAKVAASEALLNTYFVPASKIVDFIDETQQLGRDLGTSVTVLSVSEGDSKTIPTLILTLSVKGSFDAVTRTLGAIEYAPYAIRYTSLAVHKSLDDLWSGDASVVLGSVPASTVVPVQLSTTTASTSQVLPSVKGKQPL